MKYMGVYQPVLRDLDLYLCSASSYIMVSSRDRVVRLWLPYNKVSPWSTLLHALYSMFPMFRYRIIGKVLRQAGFNGIYGILLIDDRWPDPAAEPFGLFQAYRRPNVFEREIFTLSCKMLNDLALKHHDKRIGLILLGLPHAETWFLWSKLVELPDNVLVWGLRPRWKRNWM